MSEQLKPKVNKLKTLTEKVNFSGRLNTAQISDLISERKKQLESIKDKVSRKRYFTLEEKIINEENRLNQILNWQDGKQNQLSKFSFVLDTHYFEQEFLN